ncbi:MAG: GTP-binding protein, partial [archaeon]|nr:GTP-binding protein [archaeon]
MKKQQKIQGSFKILLLGNCAVGKTNILLRFTDNKFNPEYELTIGLNYRVKKMKIRDEEISVQIWDTSGEEKFKSLAKNFYRGSHGALLVYDITDEKSFKEVSNWAESLKDNADKNAAIVIIGNKVDLEEQRKIKKEQGENLAKEFGADFFETSAKENIGLNEAFQSISEKIYDSIIEGNIKMEEKGKVI